MTVTAWVSIGVALGGVAWTFIFFMIRRFLANQDQLRAAIYGETGLLVQLRGYIPRTEHEVTFQAIRDSIETSRREGHSREEKILAALEAHRNRIDEKLDDMSKEITGVHRLLMLPQAERTDPPQDRRKPRRD